MCRRNSAYADAGPRSAMDSRRKSLRRRGGARGSSEVGLQPIKDPVDERTRFACGKLLRDVDGFIDANHGRDIVPKQHLVHGQPEDIAVNGGDARQIPIVRVFRDPFIDGHPTLDHAMDKLLAEFATVFADFRLRLPEEWQSLLQRSATEIKLIKELHSQLAGDTTLARWFYRFFHSRAISMAVKAASRPRLCFFPRQRTRACLILSAVT